jgi:haloalkane dehalogenase
VLLRTPDERFRSLEGFPFEPHYLNLEGLRIHYLDEGRFGDSETVVCLHGTGTWSYCYRKLIPELSAQCRVIAPDFVGFGRSDKLGEKSAYSLAFHERILGLFVEALNLQNVTLVVHNSGGVVGLPYTASHPERIRRLVIMNTGLPANGMIRARSWSDLKRSAAFLAWRLLATLHPNLPIAAVIKAGTKSKVTENVLRGYEAPFPDARYKAGAAAWPAMLPLFFWSAGADQIASASKTLAAWNQPTLIIFSDGDSVTGPEAQAFYDLIPGAKPYSPIVIQGAGHLLQEDAGEEIAHAILNFMRESAYQTANGSPALGD